MIKKIRKLLLPIVEKVPMAMEAVSMFGLIYSDSVEIKITWGFVLIYFQIESFYLKWVDFSRPGGEGE